ncbi:hypothetical protein AAC387_Pa12g1748 [Persea americana]
MAVSNSAKYSYAASLNVANFVSIQLTQTNFLLWKTQIFGLIESQDMMGFIDGEFPMPAKYLSSSSTEAVGETALNPNFVAWRKSDQLLRGWITGTLSVEVLGLVVGLDTSAEVWKALCAAFASDSEEREFYLQQKLRLLRKGNMALSEYIRHFKGICDDLAAIRKLVSDRQKGFALLTDGLVKPDLDFIYLQGFICNVSV